MDGISSAIRHAHVLYKSPASNPVGRILGIALLAIAGIGGGVMVLLGWRKVTLGGSKEEDTRVRWGSAPIVQKSTPPVKEVPIQKKVERITQPKAGDDPASVIPQRRHWQYRVRITPLGKVIIGLVGVVALAAIAGLGYYLYSRGQVEPEPEPIHNIGFEKCMKKCYTRFYAYIKGGGEPGTCACERDFVNGTVLAKEYDFSNINAYITTQYVHNEEVIWGTIEIPKANEPLKNPIIGYLSDSAWNVGIWNRLRITWFSGE